MGCRVNDKFVRIAERWIHFTTPIFRASLELDTLLLSLHRETCAGYVEFFFHDEEESTDGPKVKNPVET